MGLEGLDQLPNQFRMWYCQQVCPAVLGNVNVKLVLATTAEMVTAPAAGATHVGEDGKFAANVIGVRKIRLVVPSTAVVFTVYVVVVVGTTKAPAAEEPQAAGEALLTAQLVEVE